MDKSNCQGDSGGGGEIPGTTVRTLSLSNALVAGAGRRYPSAASHREAITLAVRDELPEVVRLLREAGIVARPPARRRRPRRVDDDAWRAIEQARLATGVSAIEILRAVLERAGREDH